MVTEVTEENKSDILEEFRIFLDAKIKKKGSKSFNSISEIFGKLQEENHEVLLAFHKKDKKQMFDELFDVAVVALWGCMSIDAWEK